MVMRPALGARDSRPPSPQPELPFSGRADVGSPRFRGHHLNQYGGVHGEEKLWAPSSIILLGDEPEPLAYEFERRFPHAQLVGADRGFELLVARVVGRRSGHASALRSRSTSVAALSRSESLLAREERPQAVRPNQEAEEEEAVDRDLPH